MLAFYSHAYVYTHYIHYTHRTYRIYHTTLLDTEATGYRVGVGSSHLFLVLCFGVLGPVRSRGARVRAAGDTHGCGVRRGGGQRAGGDARGGSLFG